MSKNELTSFIEETCEQNHLRIEADLGDGFVRLRTDEAQKRQALQDIRSSEDVVIELLRNSRDAQAHSIYVATCKEGQTRNITVIDDGIGIPKKLHDTVFEPRVTSKLDSAHMDTWGIHGRGMALFSIKSNAQRAEVMSSTPGLGCSIFVSTDTKSLPEKTDQSTYPHFEKTDLGTISLRGPKNIIRTTCEFSIHESSRLSVYLGSVAEIASALYWQNHVGSLPSSVIFDDEDEEISIVKCLSYASNPDEFAEIAQDIGLEISERTARRIMNGELEPAVPILLKIAKQLEDDNALYSNMGKNLHSASFTKTRKSSFMYSKTKLSAQDLDLIKQQVGKIYSGIAEKYYLDDTVDISVNQKKASITINIPLENLE